MIGGMWPQMGSVIASMVFVITIFQRYLPLQLRDHVEGYTQKLNGSYERHQGRRRKKSVSKLVKADLQFLFGCIPRFLEKGRYAQCTGTSAPIYLAAEDNTELRKLLIDTSSKSIIVIEDIDCSLDLTGQRKKKKDKDEGGHGRKGSSSK
ncbi:hypothetical protein DVH24_031848 [Malus domestica]|uniref:Uncharacterized protein n=1 Tax=Malus domestica TaxID=3750 RepID=A0A498J7W1_MALDO|nr:hypothetical protein DVH24_031848 [Malus domestica]